MQHSRPAAPRQGVRPPHVAWLALASLFVSQSVAAATIVVDGTVCTLDQAITAANTDLAAGGCPAGSGADVLQLTAPVVLSGVFGDYFGPTGLPAVVSDITIEGNDLIVERAFGVAEFRIFAVDDLGALTLKRLTIRNGSVGANDGGGIYNRGELSLTRVTLAGNAADFDGGGLYNATGTTTITQSSVIDNLAVTFGGGLYNAAGTVTVTQSTVANNDGDFAGGGIWNDGTLLVSTSTISGNFCHDQGGGLVNFGLARLSHSTVRANMAADSGGIANHDSLTVINSTVSGNEFQGVGNFGAATLTHTTVSGNGIGSAFSQILNFDFPADTLTLTNSIVGHSASGVNCSGTLTDGGGNLADDTTCGPVPATLSGLDAVLTDHGGPTLTHSLVAGSSAIDAGGACGLPTDQRGFARDDGACDSGAVEFGAELPIRGAFSGLNAEEGICQNETTGEELAVPLGGTSVWNCTQAGLTANPGDVVTLRVTGERP